MTYRTKVLAFVGIVVALVAIIGAPVQAVSSDVMPSFNGSVLTVAYSGGTIFLGGDFTAAIIKGKVIARGRLAAVDAATGTLLPWAPTADARVKALAVYGTSVYAAGDFGRIGTQKRHGLARLDAGTGAVSSAFKHTVTGRPYAVAVGSGRLYLGGAITAVDGQARTRLVAFDLSTGALDAKWTPSADAQVEAIAADAARIYVGGRFHKVDSIAGYDRLAALDPVTGAIVTGFRPRPTVTTYGIAVTSAGVYTAHGGQGGRINSYTTAGVARWSATFDGDVQAVAVLGNSVYAGGHFDKACRTPRTGARGVCLDGSDARIKLAALDAGDGKLTPWTADGNGVVGVLALAASPALGTLAAGGAFTTIDGLVQKRFAQFG